MSGTETFLDSATIRFDGGVREAYGNEPVDVYVVESTEAPFWFEADYDFAQNRRDFWVVVRNFGLFNKAAAGSKSLIMCRKFTARETQVARARLTKFFEETREGPTVPYAPFCMPRGRCLGVRFPDGWVATASG